MALTEQADRWIVPLSRSDITLGEAYADMQRYAYAADDIPLIVKLVENPKYQLPGLEVFSGAASLETHDYIHLILGRGMKKKDEAFVLGFTMGSTNRVGCTEERLFGLFIKRLYPAEYQISDEDFEVYRDAVRLGFISSCEPLNLIDYGAMQQLSVAEVRAQIGLEEDLLRAYYAIEKRRYPGSPESQRLLD